MAWTWDKLSGPLAAINPPMFALAAFLKGAEKYFPIHARVATTDATVTTLKAVAIPPNHSVVVHGFVVARRTGGSAGAANDGAGYEVKFAAKNTAGVAALFAAATVTTLGESQAGWAVTVTEPGDGTILVRVTGAADNNVSWRWTARSVSVMNEE